MLCSCFRVLVCIHKISYIKKKKVFHLVFDLGEGEIEKVSFSCFPIAYIYIWGLLDGAGHISDLCKSQMSSEGSDLRVSLKF